MPTGGKSSGCAALNVSRPSGSCGSPVGQGWSWLGFSVSSACVSGTLFTFALALGSSSSFLLGAFAVSLSSHSHHWPWWRDFGDGVEFEPGHSITTRYPHSQCPGVPTSEGRIVTT